MPILFVHGVAVRDETGWVTTKRFLEEYVAPVLSPVNGRRVDILPVLWWPRGVEFAWNRISRPRSALTGQGGQVPDPRLSPAEAAGPLVSRLLSDLRAGSSAHGELTSGQDADLGSGTPVRLKDLPPDELSEVVVGVLESLVEDPAQSQPAELAIAADRVAHDPVTRTVLAEARTAEEEANRLQALLSQEIDRGTRLAGQGGGLGGFADRLQEVLSRGARLPGMILGRLATEVRKPINDLITLFLGDVFVYLTRRGGPAAGGTVPGPIPQALLDALTRARELQVQSGEDEALVVLTHSMGGQIVYDAVTHFLPNLAQDAGTRIDFWCATASQVGLFEEMKLFLASSPAHGRPPKPKVPFPDRRWLGAWWNLWDHNDFISFTAKEIFDGVDDESYATGYSLIEAHSGYLKRPSFYRRFAQKLKEAQNKNWYRP